MATRTRGRVVALALLAWIAASALGVGVVAQPPDAGPRAPEDRTAEPAVTAPSPRTREIHQLRAGDTPWWQRGVSALGLAALVGIAWAVSTDRKKMPWRVVGWGVGLQLAFAVFVLKTPVGLALFSFLNDAFARLLEFTADGSRFLFGDYLDQRFTFALNVLPTIIFFSSLMAVLYHLGLMQRVVKGFTWIMQRTMRTSGAETLSTAANIFLGQTEAPLVVKPYVEKMTQSELHAVMVGGFAGVAGGVLAAYVGMLRSHFPDIAGHLIACSVMSAPATLVIAKVMVPETEQPETAGVLVGDVKSTDANVIDAAARGASEGLTLAFNVAAMLLAFLALVAMINWGLGQIWDDLSLQKILGWIFWPLAFLMGTPPEDCASVAGLLGEKTVLNEFVAYLHLAERLEQGDPMSHRAVVIASYALCGFANFGSVAIQIGGIGGMAPSRRADLARLGLRAMFGGTLATCMTAAVAGLIV
jgi:concentrative nucleoside transporter, CNT family